MGAITVISPLFSVLSVLVNICRETAETTEPAAAAENKQEGPNMLNTGGRRDRQRKHTRRSTRARNGSLGRSGPGTSYRVEAQVQTTRMQVQKIRQKQANVSPPPHAPPPLHQLQPLCVAWPIKPLPEMRGERHPFTLNASIDLASPQDTHMCTHTHPEGQNKIFLYGRTYPLRQFSPNQ